ncbi:MAG: hypothetical protein WD638_07840 [Nitriliruptoraceae bacterium]
MSSAVLVVAHGGAGSTWQAMVVVAAVVLAAVVLGAGFGLLLIEEPSDLVTPLAGTAVVSSIGLAADALLSDNVGWALPLGVVALATLLLGALTTLDLRLPSPLPMGGIALAAVSAWALFGPLTVALHPPADILPASDDARLSVTSPADDEEVAAGTVPVTIGVTGGSIGPGEVPADEVADDPEEAGQLSMMLAEVVGDDERGDRRVVDVEPVGCTVQDPCDELTVDIDVGPGTWELTVELSRGDGTPLAPPVRQRSTFVATDGA